jgi:DNA-binding transcriptional LysR family regulator
MKIENLNLSSLKYFIDTIETGSFTEAANINRVTRPAISQAIKRLEDWSGFEIIKHQKNGLELTEDGRSFYRRAKLSYQSFEKSLLSGSQVDSTLKVGCSSSLMDQYFIPVLKKIKYPVRLHVQVGSSTQLKGFLENESVHVALFVDSEATPGFESHVISKGKFTVLSKSGRLENTLVVTEDRPEVNALRSYLTKQKISVDILRAESWSLAAKLAEALGASCLVPEFLLSSKLKKVHLSGFHQNYSVILASRRSEKLSETEVEFCNLVRSMIRE